MSIEINQMSNEEQLELDKELAIYISKQKDIKQYLNQSKRLYQDKNIRKRRFQLYSLQRKFIKEKLEQKKKFEEQQQKQKQYKDGNQKCKQSKWEIVRHKFLRDKETKAEDLKKLKLGSQMIFNHLQGELMQHIQNQSFNDLNLDLIAKTLQYKAKLQESPQGIKDFKQQVIKRQTENIPIRQIDRKLTLNLQNRQQSFEISPKNKTIIFPLLQQKKIYDQLIERINRSRQTFLKFGFKSCETESKSSSMKSILDSIRFRYKDPQGTMSVVDLWPDKNIKAYLNSCKHNQDKKDLQKISKILQYKKEFVYQQQQEYFDQLKENQKKFSYLQFETLPQLFTDKDNTSFYKCHYITTGRSSSRKKTNINKLQSPNKQQFNDYNFSQYVEKMSKQNNQSNKVLTLTPIINKNQQQYAVDSKIISNNRGKVLYLNERSRQQKQNQKFQNQCKNLLQQMQSNSTSV